MSEDNDKMRIYFLMDWCGEKQHTLDISVDYDETWPEILDHVIRVMEASFGYPFDITDKRGRMYGFGKDEDDDNVGC